MTDVKQPNMTYLLVCMGPGLTDVQITAHQSRSAASAFRNRNGKSGEIIVAPPEFQRFLGVATMLVKEGALFGAGIK